MSGGTQVVYYAFVNDMTYCKTCNEKVVLLCPKELTVPLGIGFYICFRCMDISQVGVGETHIRGIGKLRRKIHGETQKP